ncbi:DUF4307 domain-containing protein [Nocardioides limicola]|uniref:DUF4307 domain-containing protein n=1 Tax=Nocardioides limicola TaxID=2803368 RepID=UPI00193BD915|nr:DUF4307 domain-containing protein [Nocardioides sp. DJM-14]
MRPVTDLLADRYGRNRPWLRVAVVAASVAVAAAFGGWLAWTMWFHGTPDVRSTLIAFEVRSSHEAVARIDVRRKDDAVAATCKLRAFATDHHVVGELNVIVSAEEPVAGEYSIRTTREATSVDLVGCTTENQRVPR